MAETYPWPSNVVLGKRLNVALSGTLPGNGWLPALRSAIQFFNMEMSGKRIALSFAIVDRAAQANIVLSGVPGNGIHGQAELALTPRAGKEYLSKVTIKVPATPRVSQLDSTSRIVGDGVKTCILVHEMIHGVGLPNSQHTNADVFSKTFQLIEGATPDLDKIQWDASSPAMPPPVINGQTLQKIKSAWKA